MKRLLTGVVLVIVTLGSIGGVAAVAVNAYTKSQASLSQNPGDAGPGAINPANPQAPLQGANQPDRPAPVGDVQAISQEMLTLNMLNGETLSFILTSQTVFRRAEGGSIISLAEVQVGERVRVLVMPNQDGTLTAQQVVILPAGSFQPGGQPAQPGSQPGRPGAQPGDQQGQQPGAPGANAGPQGLVTAITAGSLTLQTPDGNEVLVNLTSQTRVRFLESDSLGSLNDIQVGARVRVNAALGQEGAIQAQAIVILPAGDEMTGRVISVSGSNIVLQTRQGKVTVILSDATRFIKDRVDVTLAEITQDGFLTAYGELQSDGTLLARIIVINNPPQQGAPASQQNTGTGG